MLGYKIKLFFDLEKAELFMELYGNVVMNSHALEYLKNKSNDLIRYIHSHITSLVLKGQAGILPHFIIALKFKNVSRDQSFSASYKK